MTCSGKPVRIDGDGTQPRGLLRQATRILRAYGETVDLYIDGVLVDVDDPEPCDAEWATLGEVEFRYTRGDERA